MKHHDSAYEAMPWLALYPDGQPHEIRVEHANMVDAFEATLSRAPDKPLLHYFDGSMTVRELDAAANKLARVLTAHGFGRGDRLALFTQNNPGWVIGVLATWKLGGIGVPINPMSKQRELAYLLQNSGARVLLCLDVLYNKVAREVLQNDAPDVALVITTSELDWQSRNDTRVLQKGERLAISDEDVLDLAALLAEDAEASAKAPAAVKLDGDDVALLTYTSGTTGQPKGAMNTHGNMVFNAQTYRDWMDLDPTRDRILGLAPLFHITGSVAHVSVAFLTGCPLVLAHRFDPEVMLDAIREHQPTFTIGSITAFIALMNASSAQKEDFASFRAIYSGGAPISPATNLAFEEFSGHYIHNAYGMTETASPTHLVPFGVRAPVDENSGALSIGVPVYNTLVRILSDQGQEAAVNEVGEIVDSGPQITSGYWNLPDATAAAMPDGELRTGDVGFMDEQGWFYLIDRKKDMINASGYKVWPREVEDVLYGHPAVREAAVIGVADDYRGETVKAVVSLKPGANASAEEIIGFCKERMSAYKYPRIVEFMDDLPKTVTGKILRRSLR